MKHSAVILLVLLAQSLCAQPVRDKAWRGDVKSVQFYRTGAELAFPVIVAGQRQQLVLEFDILRPEAEVLTWRVRHCDRHWQPDDLDPNEFLTGLAEGTLDDYDFSFNTRVDYVHYRAVLPGEYSSFIHSGNYVLEVFADSPDEGLLLLTRRFCVTEQSIHVQTATEPPYDGMERDRRQEVDVLVSGQVNEQWLSVWVQQNGHDDARHELRFSGYDRTALAYRHRPENIFWGGNTFRYFDCSNLAAAMYNVVRVEDYGGQLFALLRPEEDRSHKHFLSETTLPGGWKTNVWDRQNPRLEADYVWVNFSLPMAQPMLEGSVYVVGGLTDWTLDSTSRMDYDMETRAYTKRLLLKQGYYSYQLLVEGPRTSAHDSRTARLEGDHRETPNTYTVFVYQRAPNDLADRLLYINLSTSSLGY